jgi:hypothetical protein
MTLELEVAEPGHLGDGAVKERVRMMDESRQTWILQCTKTAAGFSRAVE